MHVESAMSKSHGGARVRTQNSLLSLMSLGTVEIHNKTNSDKGILDHLWRVVVMLPLDRI